MYKRILLEHLSNCRDLGGYGCGRAEMVSFGRLYRSEAPVYLENEEWDVIEKMGVKTIIDLRSESEQRFAPYIVLHAIEKISYPLQQYETHVPVDSIEKDKLAEMAASAFGKSLEEGYERMVEDAPQRMAALLGMIARALEKGAVLFHCTVGKDRTGVLSAIIYLLCGVDDADIIADYQVSSTYLAGNPMFGSVPAEMRSFLASDPETMKSFLEAARRKDYLGLLREHGLTHETVDLIKKNLLVKYPY